MYLRSFNIIYMLWQCHNVELPIKILQILIPFPSAIRIENEWSSLPVTTCLWQMLEISCLIYCLKNLWRMFLTNNGITLNFIERKHLYTITWWNQFIIKISKEGYWSHKPLRDISRSKQFKVTKGQVMVQHGSNCR